LALVVISASPDRPAHAEREVLAGGSGDVQGGAHRIRFVVGQSFAGWTEPAPGSISVGLGIWEILGRTYVVSATPGVPSALENRLFRNYPNPFNPSTRISFSLAVEAEVQIEVYDVRGRRVDVLLQGVKPAGNHTLTYQPRHLASGVYLVLMRAGSFRATQRMMLVK